MRNLAVALIAALPAVAAAAQAPAAYRAFENKLAPVTFQYPTAYEELPLPPSEQVLVARYVLLDQPAELGHLEPAQFTLARPRLFVFHFEPTGADKDGAPAGDPEPAAGRVGSFGDLLARLPGIVAVEDPRRPGFTRCARKARTAAASASSCGGSRAARSSASTASRRPTTTGSCRPSCRSSAAASA